MGSASIQTMEAISDTEQEQDQEEVGRLTQADKAHTGRVSNRATSTDISNTSKYTFTCNSIPKAKDLEWQVSFKVQLQVSDKGFRCSHVTTEI